MREDVGHSPVHDRGDRLVEELRVRGGAPLGQARHVVAGLEPVDQRVVQVEDDVDAVLAQLGDEVIQAIERPGVVAEPVQSVQARDVDALPAHSPDRVIDLLLAPLVHLRTPEADRSAVFERERVALDGDETVLAGRRLHPPAGVQDGGPEVIPRRSEREPRARGLAGFLRRGGSAIGADRPMIPAMCRTRSPARE